jgi:hypothetical protein
MYPASSMNRASRLRREPACAPTSEARCRAPDSSRSIVLPVCESNKGVRVPERFSRPFDTGGTLVWLAVFHAVLIQVPLAFRSFRQVSVNNPEHRSSPPNLNQVAEDQVTRGTNYCACRNLFDN